MKKATAILLILTLLLSGCGADKTPATTAAPTTEATEAPTAAPTTVPTEPPTEPEPVYTNPLTGEILEEPMDTRIFAVTINNLQDAMPHHGLLDADIFMEMFVNHSIIRGLALFTDPSDVPAIGSVRSTRYMFTDIAQHYDAIVAHAGGSSMVLNNVKERGVDGFNIDTWDKTDYSFRDKERSRQGKSWDACLFADGTGLYAKAQEEGIDIHRDIDKDYGFRFTEDGTPADGEQADIINLTFTYKGSNGTSRKDSSMIYHQDLGRYVYHQYGEDMVDGATGEYESFRNVLILLADIHMNQYGYHEADLITGGQGYYACGGRIIPIQWRSQDEHSPLQFFTMDGQPLLMGMGNSYIAIAPLESPVSWELAPEPIVETTAATVPQEPAETASPAEAPSEDAAG